MTNAQTDDSGRHDFDFLLGHWCVQNQRLKTRFQNDDNWESFEAKQFNQRLPGLIGNYDDFVANEWRPGFVGMSLRIFNPQTKLWTIYWLDNNTGGLMLNGLLTPPVVGRFQQGIGVFEGDDTLNGKSIRVRYTWSDITKDSAHWQQAMSADGGKTWEVNWRMILTRVPSN